MDPENRSDSPKTPADKGSADASSARLKKLSAHTPSVSRYKIENEVARGGMGAILRVWEDDLRRHLAMKVMLVRNDSSAGEELSSADENRLARFLEEAQVTGQLDHPGIVPVHELGLDSTGRVFFTMRLVTGQNLKDILKLVKAEKDGWTETRALGVILKVCEAMAFAHSKGVIHRDLKPANIMIGKFGEVYVMDWGLAKVVGKEDNKIPRPRRPDAGSGSFVQSDRRDSAGSSPDSHLLTMEGDVVGTPAYMSPEQALGAVELMAATSDVYAVGAILYHLITGKMPYVDPGEIVPVNVVVTRMQDGPPKSLHELNPRVVPELGAICEKAMQRRIEARYPDMAAMADDLRAYLEGRVVKAYKTGAIAEFKKWVIRNKGVAASIATIILLTVVGFGAVAAIQSEKTRVVGEANSKLEIANANIKNARDAAQAGEAKVSAALANILRLADVKRLADYRAEANDLWPALPEKSAAMETWMLKAQGLVSRLRLHRETLENYRAQATPYSDDDKKRDRATHPRADEIVKLQDTQAKLEAALAAPAGSAAAQSGGSTPRQQLEEVKVTIANLEKKLSERRTWRFVDTDLQWQHDTLAGLVAGLEDFSDSDPNIGIMADVEERLIFSQTVREKSLGSRKVEWDAAIASISNIAECPKYGGLALKPQIGLVPLGKDLQSGLFEFAHLATGEAATRGADGKLQINENSGLVFVLIPGATYSLGAVPPSTEKALGSPNVDPQAQKSEGPVREIVLAPFLLSKYEMTQGQWSRATRRNPSVYKSKMTVAGRRITGLEPVEQVSWEDCRTTLKNLDLVLPTEAQWECGARGGTTTIWWTGDTVSLLQGVGNLADKYAKENGAATWRTEDALNDGYTIHAPIGSFRPNGYGLHDTVGNVFEWCLDCYGDYSAQVHPGDGETLLKGAFDRAFRGGSFGAVAADARSSCRQYGTPGRTGAGLGVRPARSVAN